MKTIFKTFTALFLVNFLIVSCSPPPPPGLEVFNYAENGSTTMLLLDLPEAISSAKTISGKSSTSSTVIDIKLNSLAVGSYFIGGGNEFVYKKPSTPNTWKGLSGTITIVTNSGGLITGTFDIKSGTGIPSVNIMKGNFSDVEINP